MERYVPTQKCNGGVLFLLSKNDHKMYMFSGNSSKYVFTNSRRQAIFDLIKSNLRNNDYDLAMV